MASSLIAAPSLLSVLVLEKLPAFDGHDHPESYGTCGTGTTHADSCRASAGAEHFGRAPA